MNPNRVLHLTRLNECEAVYVLADAIDAVHCCESKVPGTLIYLRSGECLKVSESAETVVRLLGQAL